MQHVAVYVALGSRTCVQQPLVSFGHSMRSKTSAAVRGVGMRPAVSNFANCCRRECSKVESRTGTRIGILCGDIRQGFVSQQTFTVWADAIKSPLRLTHQPTLSFGFVPWDSLNMIDLCYKAYSHLRQSLLVSLNEHVIVGDSPLHHSALFHNEYGYSYFSNCLVKERLVTVADLLRSP